VNGWDSKRLRGLLKTSSERRIKVFQWPLYSQEFIGLIPRARLLDQTLSLEAFE